MRIGVSLPDNLLNKFDSIIMERGYSSRSEGIRDAIRSYINYYEWMNDISGRRVGTITLIYDHTKRGLSNAVADVQHDYVNLIKSSIHIHLDKENCLEVIIFDGDGKDVKGLDERLMALKGVKYVKLNTTPPAEKL